MSSSAHDQLPHHVGRGEGKPPCGQLLRAGLRGPGGQDWDGFEEPHSFPDFNYTFVSTQRAPEPNPDERWTNGPSLDRHGTFRFEPARPLGEKPKLAALEPDTPAQLEQQRRRS